MYIGTGKCIYVRDDIFRGCDDKKKKTKTEQRLCSFDSTYMHKADSNWNADAYSYILKRSYFIP